MKKGETKLAHYVKFMRGTPEAYKNLAVKDNDTLYFISSEKSLDGALYLGSKLISGESEGLTSFTLNDLEDVLISEGLADRSLLIYSDGHWKNVAPDELVFIGASEDARGLAGLVPAAPGKGKTNLFLRSDGTWAEITVESAIVADTNVITIHNTDETILHTDLIQEAIRTEEIAVEKGDIAIIKDLIINDKWQYTSYVYNGENWAAMDGNYSAENVYFDEDFIFTTTFGTVSELTNGSAKKAAAGLNLKQFFASLFAEEKEPVITSPTYSLSASANLAANAEIGNYINGYSWNGTWSPGSYGYGSK
jgi:hypothetical protein